VRENRSNENLVPFMGRENCSSGNVTRFIGEFPSLPPHPSPGPIPRKLALLLLDTIEIAGKIANEAEL
jgi:hypothetical protein